MKETIREVTHCKCINWSSFAGRTLVEPNTYCSKCDNAHLKKFKVNETLRFHINTVIDLAIQKAKTIDPLVRHVLHIAFCFAFDFEASTLMETDMICFWAAARERWSQRWKQLWIPNVVTSLWSMVSSNPLLMSTSFGRAQPMLSGRIYPRWSERWFLQT